MKPISESDFQSQIKGIYSSVFASEDPYNSPFQPNIQPRLLLYWFRYGLKEDEPWLVPITRGIKSLGEDGFYLTSLRRVAGGRPWHWYVPLDEANLYIKEVYPVENAIYSVNGKWGIICSEEDHAVAGGSPVLIEAIRASISDWDYRINLFIENWKKYHEQNQVSLDWLPNLLVHIYGMEETKTLLNKANLGWLFDR